MDAATAQTGLTIWQAIILASIPGILTAILGSHLNLKNSIKISEKRFKSDLEIKREEIKIYKERALVELKIGVLKEVELLQNEWGTEGSNWNNFRSKLISIRDRISSYVDEEGLYEIVHKGVEEASNLYDLAIEESGDKELSPENKLSLIKLIKILHMTHEKLSFNLGFKTRTEETIQREKDEANLIFGKSSNAE